MPLFLSGFVFLQIIQPLTLANPFSSLVFASALEVNAACPGTILFGVDLDLVAVDSLLVSLRPAVAANLNSRVENVLLGIDLEVELHLEIAEFFVGAQERVGCVWRTAADNLSILDLIRSVPTAFCPAGEV